MVEEKKPASKLYYSTKHETREGIKETVFSVESQTNEGALDLFKKLKEETKHGHE